MNPKQERSTDHNNSHNKRNVQTRELEVHAENPLRNRWNLIQLTTQKQLKVNC